VLLQLQVK